MVVLAAGRGERMGDEQGSKLLLPWRNGRPIIWHTVHNALGFRPSQLVVVVRPDLPELTGAVRDLPVQCVPNPRYRQGMGTSLAAGIDALEGGIRAVLVMLGDQPAVHPNIIAELLAAYLKQGKPITMPVYGDHVGPPALFTRHMFPELLKLRGDIGGRQLAANHPRQVCLVPFSADMQPLDVDTSEDYHSALREEQADRPGT